MTEASETSSANTSWWSGTYITGILVRFSMYRCVRGRRYLSQVADVDES